MGVNLSCFRQPVSPQSLGEYQHDIMKHVDDDDDRSGCSSGMSFMMLGCFWKKETKQRQLQLKERLQQQQQQGKLKKAKELTLGDWLIASSSSLPGSSLQKKYNVNGGTGEYHVVRHCYSKKVFPSSVGDNVNKPKTQSFSKKRLLEEKEEEMENIHEVSMSRSQTGKSKKRVSFRLPEEADIFIFQYSSSGEEESAEKEII